MGVEKDMDKGKKKLARIVNQVTGTREKAGTHSKLPYRPKMWDWRKKNWTANSGTGSCSAD